MIALEIEDIKGFMNHLLRETTFDSFETLSVNLTTLIHFSINGNINMDFLDTDERENYINQKYITWGNIKPNIYQILRGNKTPSSLKISLSLSEESTANLIKKSGFQLYENTIQGFLINIIFENKILKIITGTNYKTFSTDKSIEFYFDHSIIKFLKKHGIIHTNIN